MKKSRYNYIREAKNVLEIEAEAILHLKKNIGSSFLQTVDRILKCKGRVVLTGIGKSGLVARKIAATLASTGTPALFLHPSEGVHGDLGVLVKDDILLAVSNSGETKELLQIIPVVKRIGVFLISITRTSDSTLAKNSDIVILSNVKKEACPFDLSPTASSTAVLALGDALAIVLLKMRGFKPEDFALLHPAGEIGRRVLLRVKDIMRTGQDIPIVNENAYMKEAILEITSKKMGCTSVVNSRNALVGIVTDQDVRTTLKKGEDNFFNKKVGDIMTKDPKTIGENELVAKAIRVTEENSISTLLIIDKKKTPIGIVHLHDLLKANV